MITIERNEQTPTRLIRVAIAEDSPMARLMLQTMAQQHGGFEILKFAENGPELFAWMKSAAELPDACILDYHMPEWTGADLARQLKAHFVGVQLFGCTSVQQAEELSLMTQSGVQAIFGKGPRELHQLFTSICAACSPISAVRAQA